MLKINTSVTEINVQHFIDHKVHDFATKNCIYSWNDFFRSKLILKLNDLFDDGWKLEFTQDPKDSWLVDVFCEDLSMASKIKNVILSSIPDFKFQVFYNKRAI